MMYFVSDSGIPEAIERVPWDGWSVLFIVGFILAWIGFLIWAVPLMMEFRMTKLFKGIGIFFLGAIGVTLMYGGFMYTARQAANEVTFQNIQENFAIQDLRVSNIDGYSAKNTSNVYGSSDGRILEFKVAYSGEHDVMMPVQDSVELEHLPVRNNSPLDNILASEEE